MGIYQAVSGRQVLLPIVSDDMSYATGTLTVDSLPSAVSFTLTVASISVSVTTGASIAATADAIEAAITAETSITTVSASSDGVSVVTLTAASYGTAANDIGLVSGESDVSASAATLTGASTGVALSDLTIKATGESAYLSDPSTTLQLALTEVSSSSAPGWYELRVIPTGAGVIYLSVAVGSYSDTFAIQVEHEGIDMIGARQAGAEGDYTFTAEDSSENAIEGASVRVYDSAGTGFITRGTTDSSGEITFALPTGDYEVRTFKRGYDFSAINPTEITVTANSANDPVIAELVPSTSAAAGTIAITGLHFDEDNSEVLFASSAVSASSVSSDGKVLTAVVPSGSDTAVTVKVRKPDPDDSAAYLVSNSLTLVRSS